jgi:hypothetical protein
MVEFVLGVLIGAGSISSWGDRTRALAHSNRSDDRKQRGRRAWRKMTRAVTNESGRMGDSDRPQIMRKRRRRNEAIVGRVPRQRSRKAHVTGV